MGLCVADPLPSTWLEQDLPALSFHVTKVLGWYLLIFIIKFDTKMPVERKECTSLAAPLPHCFTSARFGLTQPWGTVLLLMHFLPLKSSQPNRQQSEWKEGGTLEGETCNRFLLNVTYSLVLYHRSFCLLWDLCKPVLLQVKEGRKWKKCTLKCKSVSSFSSGFPNYTSCTPGELVSWSHSEWWPVWDVH